MGHLALRVTDTRAMAERLAGEGVEILTQPVVLATQQTAMSATLRILTELPLNLLTVSHFSRYKP